MGESFTLRRRTKETIDIVSPFPDKKVRPHPRWYERIRGFLGLSVLVVLTGVVAAILVALALLAAAIFMATAFN